LVSEVGAEGSGRETEAQFEAGKRKLGRRPADWLDNGMYG
jgi:hypothetical protein